MVDLSTSYAGLTLKNPLVVSASPLCNEIGNLRRMEDAGQPPSCSTHCLRSRST